MDFFGVLPCNTWFQSTEVDGGHVAAKVARNSSSFKCFSSFYEVQASKECYEALEIVLASVE